ncbi:PTS sugar transporter subunit IIC [Paraliobacillus salinarum]|uniref:PTS sugar transporter subunit IIC n=1 Tax=Paraliobacillus salinarum TaxID=1158996 RepID=UPI0015F4A6EA|nr:PTS transporter subunit EIIC [Paraliobacillus salinarum]
MEKENVFFNKLQKWLTPVGDFLANQKHFASISAGLMSIVGLTIIGAIFQIIANPPITPELIAEGGIFATILTPWYNFSMAYKEILLVPYNMTMNLFSVITSFTIAYQLGKRYNISSLSSGIVSLVIFLIVAAPMKSVTLADESIIKVLNTEYLGGTGLFTAILVALVTVEITRFCRDKNIVIRMPDVVPSFLSDSFSAIIPLLINVVIFYGASLTLNATMGILLPGALMNLLAAPLGAINSIPGMLFLILIATLLWIIGIHGAMVIMPIQVPLLIQAITENGALVAAGQDPIFHPVFIMGAISLAGGTGNTLAFTIMSIRSKSKQLKAIGKAGIIPGIFGVNEPVLFGSPIVFNPILAIPFVLGTIVVALLLWLGFTIGLITPGYILILSLLPIGFGSFLSSMNIMNLIYAWLMVPVTAVVWYPFFKVYERQLVEKERIQEENTTAN